MFVRERLNIVKMSLLSNLIYRFKAIPVKIPASYIMNINKLIITLYGEAKTNIVVKKNKVGVPTLSEFKAYYKAIAIKTL